MLSVSECRAPALPKSTLILPIMGNQGAKGKCGVNWGDFQVPSWAL